MLRTQNKINLSEKKLIFKNLLSWVSHIHENGLIHGNLSLNNILINSKTYGIKLGLT